MAADPAKNPFDPNAWVEAQRRNFEAFTSAGQIVAESMRSVAERQAAMMQQAMHDLWGEMQAVGTGGASAARPGDQLGRMRTAFERVVGQVQEISDVMMRAQAQAVEVLNRCAAANAESFGGVAPDMVALQRTSAEAMRTATTQVAAAIEEMRRRMTDLEGETRQAMGGAAAGAAERSSAAAGKGSAASARSRAGKSKD